MSVIERLRTNSLVSETGCWLPKRPVKGYRYVRVDGVLIRAHRAVMGATGTDVVLHLCDTHQVAVTLSICELGHRETTWLI